MLKLTVGVRKLASGVMQMKADKSLMLRFIVGHGDVAAPIPAIVGPLLGLVYIIVLPFVGVVAFILASGYRATQSLAKT